MNNQHNLLIIGCGYSGLAIAKIWQKKFQAQIYGTTRTRQKTLQSQNILALNLEDESAITKAIEAANAIILSAPPPDPAEPFAKAIAQTGAWLAYLSTTAVYGDHQGEWVDETTPPSPASPRGQARLEVEQFWQSQAPRINIYRLAGIYGPGRGPFEKLQNGRAQMIIKKDQVFGRIHVDDIARILLASYEAQDQSQIYNLSDDLPAPPQDVLLYAAQKLGTPPPASVNFEHAKLSPMARSFYGENKRISNAKIRQHFGTLLYPDYQSGLDAIFAQNQRSSMQNPDDA